jgi:hypothetical protein
VVPSSRANSNINKIIEPAARTQINNSFSTEYAQSRLLALLREFT